MIPMGFWSPRNVAAGGDSPFVNLLLHFEGTDGAQVFTDSSLSGHVPSFIASDIETSTTDPKFGVTSCRSFASGLSNGFIEYSESVEAIGTRDFCVEVWVKRTSSFDGLNILRNVGSDAGSPGAFGLTVGGGPFGGDLVWGRVGSPTVYGSPSHLVTPGAWRHVAFTRTDGIGRMFVHGQSGGLSFADAIDYSFDYFQLFSSGTNSSSDSQYFDEFRFTIGDGVYTDDFTPPVAPFSDP